MVMITTAYSRIGKRCKSFCARECIRKRIRHLCQYMLGKGNIGKSEVDFGGTLGNMVKTLQIQASKLVVPCCTTCLAIPVRSATGELQVIGFAANPSRISGTNLNGHRSTYSYVLILLNLSLLHLMWICGTRCSTFGLIKPECFVLFLQVASNNCNDCVLFEFSYKQWWLLNIPRYFQDVLCQFLTEFWFGLSGNDDVGFMR